MVNLSAFAKNFAANMFTMSEGAVLTFVRNWLKSKLRDFTVYDLDYAVRNNVDLWRMSSKQDKGLGMQLAMKYRNLYEKYAGQITVELVLKWLKEDKPEFASYIENDRSGHAKAWLEGMLDKIKLMLWESDNVNKGI